MTSSEYEAMPLIPCTGSTPTTDQAAPDRRPRNPPIHDMAAYGPIARADNNQASLMRFGGFVDEVVGGAASGA
jgi:hypothetical protein